LVFWLLRRGLANWAFPPSFVGASPAIRKTEASTTLCAMTKNYLPAVSSLLSSKAGRAIDHRSPRARLHFANSARVCVEVSPNLKFYFFLFFKAQSAEDSDSKRKIFFSFFPSFFHQRPQKERKRSKTGGRFTVSGRRSIDQTGQRIQHGFANFANETH